MFLFILIYQITCETTGWIGLGLSPNGGMTGADIAIGWITSDGKAYLQVRANRAHDHDFQQIFYQSTDHTLQATPISKLSYKVKIS